MYTKKSKGRNSDEKRRSRFLKKTQQVFGKDAAVFWKTCSVFFSKVARELFQSRFSSSTTLSRYCPYWFLSMG